MFHNHKTAGHPGELVTYNSVKQHYWWPGIQMFIKIYVQGCRICQQFKINHSPANPAYRAIEGAKTTQPFAHCSMDLITDLRTVNEYDSILVMVNQGLSNGVILSPCTKSITWEGIVEFLWDNLFKRFGSPDQIISDHNSQFAARAFQELFKLLNITSSLSTAYHPQMDRVTEQVNQEIAAYLSIYCTAHPEDWPNSLTTLEFTHNNRRHADRTHTPFKLIPGDSPISVPITFYHTKYLKIEEKIKQMRRSISSTWISQNKNITLTLLFIKGQKFWLDTWNIKTMHHEEITPKCEGPFKIDKALGPVTYQFKLPETWNIHNVFHVFSTHISKMKSMGTNTHDLLQNYLKENKSMK